MRGGTSLQYFTTPCRWGLSPRARGNPHVKAKPDASWGPIPACAGEPNSGFAFGSLLGAYPRVRGGTFLQGQHGNDAEGLSPRARGNRKAIGLRPKVQGPIPACAGEPNKDKPQPIRCRAYPRVRGGTALMPRPFPPPQGLSPRARGNPVSALAHLGFFGPIPACAGEPEDRMIKDGDIGAYPRVRGGTGYSGWLLFLDEGLSPRARGNRGQPHGQAGRPGPIPACAGEPAPSRCG